MINNALQFVNIGGDSLHDTSDGRNIKEQVNWRIQETIENILMHVCHCIIYQIFLEPFFDDLARSLHSDNCKNFVYMGPKLRFVLLFCFIFGPFTNDVAAVPIYVGVQRLKPNNKDELGPMAVVVQHSCNCLRLDFSLLVLYIVNKLTFIFILYSSIFK